MLFISVEQGRTQDIQKRAGLGILFLHFCCQNMLHINVEQGISPRIQDIQKQAGLGILFFRTGPLVELQASTGALGQQQRKIRSRQLVSASLTRWGGTDQTLFLGGPKFLMRHSIYVKEKRVGI